jgi:hypothetical protein
MRRYDHLPRCDKCGRFHLSKPGSSYAMRYSGHPPTPDHEQTRCVKCTHAHGPLTASNGIAEWTAGVVTADVGGARE